MQEQIIIDLQLSLPLSDSTHLVIDSIVQPQGAQLSHFHQLSHNMQHVLHNIPSPLSNERIPTVAPMDVWLETPSIIPLAPADTPSELDNWANKIPSPVPGLLPHILVEATGKSPVIIFFSDHAHEYFV